MCDCVCAYTKVVVVVCLRRVELTVSFVPASTRLTMSSRQSLIQCDILFGWKRSNESDVFLAAFSMSFPPSSESADVIIQNDPGRTDSLLGPGWKLDCESKAQKQRSDDNDHDDKIEERNDEQQRKGTHALTTTQRGTSTVGSTDSCTSTTFHEVTVAAYAGCITTFIDHP